MIWLLIAVGLYLGVLCAVAWVSLHPFRTPLFISPGALGAPQEEFDLASTDGVRLKCWWVEAEGARTVAILCHGYVMNRSELTPLAHWLWQKGISSLLFDFRAHGRTRGGASTIGWKEADDVAAAVEEARRRIPGAKIVLIGSSMGSAASVFAASMGTHADALVLDSCYSRLVQASFGWWRFLGSNILSIIFGPTILLAGPFARINPFKIDVAHSLKNVNCPILFLHGRCDNLALPSEAERNLATVRGKAEIVWFDNCGHSEFRWTQAERYYRALDTFLLNESLIESPRVREVAHI